MYGASVCCALRADLCAGKSPTLLATFGRGMWGAALFTNVWIAAFLGEFAMPVSVEVLAHSAGFSAPGGKLRRWAFEAPPFGKEA